LDRSAVPTYEAAVALLKDHFAGTSPAISEAITCLEDHYHCGVCWGDATEVPELAEFWRMSTIVSFATSDPAGWAAFGGGDLRERPPGEVSPGRHVFLVARFDFSRGCHVANNSWGRQFGQCGEVLFQFEALHEFVITKVFFTTDSIQGKTHAGYEEVINRFPGTLYGMPIDCAHVNLMAAMYNSDWICDSQSSASESFQVLLSGDSRGFASVPMESLHDLTPSYIAYDLKEYIQVTLRKVFAELQVCQARLAEMELSLRPEDEKEDEW
jgi:hypothetical protein